jgi:4'-phosphopantetheinyl transferase EntD
VGAWTQLLERAEKEEVRKSEAVAGRAAAEEALQRGTLEELRGLLRELDATAWMYE